jgi:hypothetical protein
MQQSIQRMAGQILSMGQEVSQLSQLATQLAQLHSNHFQQMQSQLNSSNMRGGALYELAGNEQATAHLLQTIAEVCSEMNHHLRTISQQLGQAGANQQLGGGHHGFSQGANMQANGTGGASYGMAQDSSVQSGMSGQGQKPALEGPIYTDTTHYSRDDYPGHSQKTPSRMTSSIGPSATASMGASGGMSGGQNASSGANMTSGSTTTEYFSDQSGAMGTSVQGSQMRVGSSQSASGLQTRSSQGGQNAGQGSMGGGAQGTQGIGGQSQLHSDVQPMLSTQNLTGGAQGSRMGQGQGGMSMQSSQMSAQGTMRGQGAQMNARPALSEDDLKHELNEYREEPHANSYPYNRYTT